VNVLVLPSVVVMRFAMALLADCVTAGGANSHAVAVVDGTTTTVTGIAFTLMRVDVFGRRQLLRRCVDPQVIRVTARVAARGPVLHAASIVPAFVPASACLVVSAILAVCVSLVRRPGLGASFERDPPAGMPRVFLGAWSCRSTVALDPRGRARYSASGWRHEARRTDHAAVEDQARALVDHPVKVFGPDPKRACGHHLGVADARRTQGGRVGIGRQDVDQPVAQQQLRGLGHAAPVVAEEA
jgi:hypothetical protein